ncbi:MAG TPA: response regulator [Candidatus Limnocylindrales bacterium]|jgi:DNA-binding response OmpR family regulator|nr:response regulator [Candidatus Limnocylindrales bacterium]
MTETIILHVEDDPDDAFFVRRAIAKIDPGCKVQRLPDGESAVNFLASVVESKGDTLSPDLLLLDIKLPGLDGFEVLSWVRRQTYFNPLPIVMLSGSVLESDRHRAKDLGAAGYIVKTSDYREVAKTVLSFVPDRLASRQNGPH